MIDDTDDTKPLATFSLAQDLYCHDVDIVLCRCLTHDEAEQVLNAYQNGTCGGHLSGMATS